MALLDLLDGSPGNRISRCCHVDATLVSISSGLDFCGILCLGDFGINALSVRSFAEAESFFSSIKVIAILVFIILGLGAMFELVSFDGHHEAIMFKHLTANGLFPMAVLPLCQLCWLLTMPFQEQS